VLSTGGNLEGQTEFEKLHQVSLQTFASVAKCNLSFFTLPPPIEMKLKNFKNKENIVLFTGGKDSLLTCQILDFHEIPYKTLFIKEKGKSFKKIKADIRLKSKLCEEYSSPTHHSKNIPLLYAYYLMVLEKFPGSILWTGGEYRTIYHSMMVSSVDQTDLCFNELNSDKDIDGQVYSVINCLKEFDTFRIMTNYFGYDYSYSYKDRPERLEGLTMYSIMNTMMNMYEDFIAEDCPFELELTKYINHQITLESPMYYDFSNDVLAFLRSIL